jgi:hypothetical protein
MLEDTYRRKCFAKKSIKNIDFILQNDNNNKLEQIDRKRTGRIQIA